MRATVVVVTQPFADSFAKLIGILILSEVDVLVFGTTPHAFNEHVGQRPAASIHAHGNPMSLYRACEHCLGELAA